MPSSASPEVASGCPPKASLSPGPAGLLQQGAAAARFRCSGEGGVPAGRRFQRKPREWKSELVPQPHFRAKPIPCGELSQKHQVFCKADRVFSSRRRRTLEDLAFCFFLILHPLLLPMKVLILPTFLFPSFHFLHFPTTTIMGQSK